MIINTERVNSLKSSLSFKNSNWTPVNPLEWAWLLHQSHHRIVMEMSADSGIYLTSNILSGMCQINQSLNFEGLMNETVDGVITRLSNNDNMTDNTARGVMISGYPALMASFLGNDVPHLILLAWAGIGCRTFLVKE